MKGNKASWFPVQNGKQVTYFRRRVLWSRLIFSLAVIFTISLLWFSSDYRHESFSNASFQSTPIRESNYSWRFDKCSWKRNSRDRFTCQAEKSLIEYNNWVNSQSKTLLQAKQHYQRRYKRSPPVWFTSWFRYCKENNVTIIDDYDQLELDLSPFRVFEDKSLLIKAMEDVAKREGAYEGKGGPAAIGLVSHLQVKDGELNIKLPRHPEIVRGLTLILDPIKNLLPNLEILVNWGDEPLIRAPERKITYNDLPPTPQQQTAKSIASFDSRPCPISGVLNTRSVARLFYKPRHDPCNQNDLVKLIKRHGKFQHPGNQYNITFPILSTAKMTEHQDILFPMRGDVYGLFHANSDPIPWEEKTNSLFWRGSTSGQENTDQNWNMTHRSRFVFNAQMWNQTMSHLDSLSLIERVDYKSQLSRSTLAKERDLSKNSIEALSRLPLNTFNASFTRFTFCHQHGCEKIEKVSPKGPQTPSNATTQHKFLFDLDGLGMSERYYGLLVSNSVVLKQTEWAEWHDEYFIPWVHFVPVSLNMEELPELMDFMINDERGQAIAKRISKDSATWVQNSLSFKAQAAFMLRLLNEYSDIMYGPKL